MDQTQSSTTNNHITTVNDVLSQMNQGKAPPSLHEMVTHATSSFGHFIQMALSILALISLGAIIAFSIGLILSKILRSERGASGCIKGIFYSLAGLVFAYAAPYIIVAIQHVFGISQ